MLSINVAPYNQIKDRTFLLSIVSKLADKKIKTSQFDSAYIGDISNLVAHDNDRPIGFISARHLPGLDGVAEMHLFIDPSYHRNGVGSRLIAELEKGLDKSHIHELYHFVDDLKGIPAQFLEAQQFTVTHTEYQLERPLTNLPPVPQQPTLAVRTPPKRVVKQQFISLYDQSFGDHPWYQPYSPEEFSHLFDRFPDILFLYTTASTNPIGFAWLQLLSNRAIIEPIGMLPQWQGKGYGKYLLTQTMHLLKEKQYPLVQIGLWSNNKSALHLYESAGFTINNQEYQFSKQLNPPQS